jgi:hypothetical protein
MRTTFLLTVLLLSATTACEGSDDASLESTEGAATARLDSLANPTDTKVTLALGQRHGSQLRPDQGWHAFHFRPTKTEYVRFVMEAEPGHPTIWSYLRIEQEDPAGKKPWLHNTAGVANTRTNTCEITMKVEAGFQYDVIATSQMNLVNKDTTRHVSNGGYRVAVLPLDPGQVIPE